MKKGAWGVYIKTLLASSQVKNVVFATHEGGMWAHSKEFSVKSDEVKNLLEAYLNATKIIDDSFYINNNKYLLTKADNHSVYGVKDTGGGCICIKTNYAILIATYDESVQSEKTINIVEKLGEYVIETDH